MLFMSGFWTAILAWERDKFPPFLPPTRFVIGTALDRLITVGSFVADLVDFVAVLVDLVSLSVWTTPRQLSFFLKPPN